MSAIKQEQEIGKKGGKWEEQDIIMNWPRVEVDHSQQIFSSALRKIDMHHF